MVLADTALYLPDFSANERAFQLLYQVIGRIGRHQAGRAIIQTYSPDHPSIQAAVAHDFAAFYTAEIAERKLIQYPPFIHILTLTCERKSQRGAQSAATRLAEDLRQNKRITVLGPSPAFHEKTPAGWRWQIVIKARTRKELVGIIHNLPAQWHHNIDPLNLL